MSSYDYSQLNKIIEMQYKRKKDNSNNWFLEETLKLGKGYIKPSNYLNNIVNKISETSNEADIDEPLYLHI
jgi:hypothetical protein